MKSHPRLLKLFRRFNRLYFKGRLEEPIVCFERSKSPALGRLIRPQAIRYRVTDGGKTWTKFRADVPCLCVSERIKDEEFLVQQTMLHEMAHLKLPNRVGHGPRFRRELARLVRAGAYDNLI